MKRLPLILILPVLVFAPGCVNVHAEPGPSELPRDKDGWKDLARGVKSLLKGEHGVIFSACDTLALPGEPVDLAVRLKRAKNLLPLEGVTIGFYDGNNLLGSAPTDDDGRARISWVPPKAGDYFFTVRPIAVPADIDRDYRDVLKVAPSPLHVAARTKETPFVVIDLDRTLVADGFDRVLSDSAKPMPDSAEVTTRIAGRYTIIYLTHRPDLLSRKSKDWLRRNGYPAGPLLVSSLREAVGDSGRFKAARLAELRKEFPNVAVGIGDKLSDAKAYEDNGLTAYLIPFYERTPGEMRAMAKAARELRGTNRLQVVSGWREVEKGIFDGARFPAEAFAKRLEEEANRMKND